MLHPINFSPFDLRVYLRIALVALAWRHLSHDYGALATLSESRPNFEHILPWVNAVSQWLSRFLNSETKVIAVQLCGGLACAVAIWKPARPTLLAAFLAVSAIEFPAFHWRYQNWDMDLPLAVLLMSVIAPIDVTRALSPSREPSTHSTALGWMLAVYMAGMYLLSGVSKVTLTSWGWPLDVRFGLNWRTQFLDCSQYADATTFLGASSSRFFLSYESLAAEIAAVVFAAELLMPFALLSRRMRVLLPAIMFGSHVAIAATMGIFFSATTFLGPAIFVPWSRARPAPDFSWSRQWAACSAVGAILLLGPALANVAIHPFANNMVFGWHYRIPGQVHAIGYKSASGELRPYPNGRGGFLDYRHANQLHGYAAKVIRGQATLSELKAHVKVALLAARPPGSNRFLLGPFALPDHRWLYHDPATECELSTLYLIRGTPCKEDSIDPFRPVRVKWETVNQVH